MVKCLLILVKVLVHPSLLEHQRINEMVTGEPEVQLNKFVIS